MVEAHEMSGVQVEWNMAQLLNMELGRLRTLANNDYRKGNYGSAINSLEAIEQTSIHLMKKEERIKLKEIKSRLRLLSLIVAQKSSFNVDAVRKARETEIELKEEYEKYNEMLQDLLDKYGVFGGRKKDASRMKI